jgi:hypothetical protein
VDFCLCRTAGVESEMELAYAGLQQLCRPLAGHSEELATLHRNALDQVFGATEGAPPERFLVGIAALDLVATVAQKQPVLWLVDDAQWIDRASMQAIAFVGRRLFHVATGQFEPRPWHQSWPQVPQFWGLGPGAANKWGPVDPEMMAH